MCSSKANLRYFLWCNLFWRFLRSAASVLPVQSSSATRTSACCGIRPNRTLGWLIFPQLLSSGPILCMAGGYALRRKRTKIANIHKCRLGLFQFKKLLAVFKGFVVRHVKRYRGPSIYRQPRRPQSSSATHACG